MSSFNKVILLGNLTRDPQMKYLPNSTPVTEFGVATNRRFKTQAGEDREEVCFVDCSAFGKTAEAIDKWMTKGKPILVEGRLKLDQWDDKNGGGKRSKLSVIVDNFQFISDGKKGGQNEPAGVSAGGGAFDPNDTPEEEKAPWDN
jgi:single-strand DNA-binding protein